MKSILIGLVSLALAACVDSAARVRIEQLEESLDDTRSFQAEQTTKISDLETQLRALSGRVDEIEFAQRQKLGTVLDTLKSDVSSLRRRVPPPAIVPASALEEDEAAFAKVPEELAKPFGEGLQSVREGNFTRAAAQLEEALYLGGGTEWAPPILFWLAVAYDGANEHQKAITAYHDLASRFPRYSRTPLVLLRQASVLIRRGDKKTARLVLNKLIADFPKSNEAVRAKERLKDL